MIIARGKMYDIHWLKDGNDVTADILTPISGYEKIHLNGKIIASGSNQIVDASMTSNDVLNWRFKSLVNTQTFAIDVKLKTPYDFLSSFELDAGIIQVCLSIKVSYLNYFKIVHNHYCIPLLLYTIP